VAVYVWIALGIAVVAILASAAYAAARGIGAWHDFRRLRRRAMDDLADLSRRGVFIEQHLAAAGESGARLQRASAELNESLAGMRTLVAALADVRATVARAAGLIQRK
jgi:hypothetical protein